MSALDGLSELHLVAQQDNVPRTRAHGGQICQRDLAGLIDKQIVEHLVSTSIAKTAMRCLRLVQHPMQTRRRC